MLIPAVKYIQYLSLDVVAGSLSIGYLIVRLLNLDTPISWWFILALSVWVVYSVDHILDSFVNNDEAMNQRHRFFFRYRTQILVIVGTTAVLDFVLSIIFLEIDLVIMGLIILGITVIYFSVINLASRVVYVKIPKELIISLIYMAGIALAPFYWYGQLPALFIIYILLIVWLLAFSESVIAGYFEYEVDKSDNHTSFSIKYGLETSRKFIISLHTIIEISILIALFRVDGIFYFAVLFNTLLMNFLLGIMIMFPNNSFIKKNYRLIGESAFILPLSLLLF